ncbi:MAG: hypothetical protein RLZZ04_242 [Cyanobacteriota bacterium]|jgi:hypothetical protein
MYQTVVMTNNNFESEYSTREKLKEQIESDRGWYFVTFIRDLPDNRPYGFSLFNEPFVLFKDQENNLVCYSLSSLHETKKDNRVEMPPAREDKRSFEAVEKQGEIWFYRGKT